MILLFIIVNNVLLKIKATKKVKKQKNYKIYRKK